MSVESSESVIYLVPEKPGCLGQDSLQNRIQYNILYVKKKIAHSMVAKKNLNRELQTFCCFFHITIVRNLKREEIRLFTRPS